MRCIQQITAWGLPENWPILKFDNLLVVVYTGIKAKQLVHSGIIHTTGTMFEQNK